MSAKPKCAHDTFTKAKPLFICLKAAFFDAFENGTKTTEYRRRSARWNATTCAIGRRVILSRGYGKGKRLTGVIEAFHYDTVPHKLPGWVECYGRGAGDAACIASKVYRTDRTDSRD